MISLEEIQKLADLARLAISDEDKKSMQKDIDGILSYVGQINNLKEVEADASLLPVENVMRQDEVKNTPGEYTERLVKAAPKKDKGYIKVKKIL